MSQMQNTLGDLVIVLLGSTLAGLRDRLKEDGYTKQSEFVDTLCVQADEYIAKSASGRLWQGGEVSDR